jgi:DNA-binding NtrC family response regulator
MTQQPARILVVDDERNIRHTLQIVLRTEGYHVDVTSNGEEALEKCREQHYEVALVDLQMPKMGGLELLRYLRGLSPETAVVILTAYGTVARAVQAMKLGAVDFLEKPFDPRALRLLVEEILLRQRLGSQGSVEELLHLAALARGRKASLEARSYLKAALLRDGTRPEPYYQLGSLCEQEGDERQAVQYYYLALDASHTFHPAREALVRLQRLKPETS